MPTPSTATAATCKSDATAGGIACHFGGNPGNYDVSFVLGGTAAGKTEVQAETLREMLAEVDTAAGVTSSFSMKVNVRQPQGQPDWPQASDGTSGLDMFFKGPAPELNAIAFTPSASNSPVLYIGSDSTACDQDGPTTTGWGQRLPQFFGCGISVANYANSGALTECSPTTTACQNSTYYSFYDDPKMWPAVKALMKANDIFLIEFAHNDKQTPQAAYEANLTRYITETRALGAIPILATPIARAQFTGNTVNTPQLVNDVGVNLPQTIIQVGQTNNVPVIDLTSRTITWLNSVGAGAKTQFYADQVTHLNVAGANTVAGFVRDAIKTQNITPLVNYLR
jgi:lysophospholipase L1-like esterase